MDISVKNYQSLIDVNLKVEGLTIIKGQSNAGKSSLFKALYSATHNRFRQGCVRFGQDSCIVSVRYPDSPVILRVERSSQGGSPLVSLGCKALGYKSFNKMNRDVPPEIQQFNNFGKISASTSDEFSLNFTPQFTPPLLVQFSPKKVVEILAYSQATQDALKAKKQIDEKNLKLKGAIENMDSVVSSSKQEVARAQKHFNRFKDRDAVLVEKQTYQSLSDELQDYLDLQFDTSAISALISRQKYCEQLLDYADDCMTNQAALRNYLNLQALLSQLKKLDEQESLVNQVCAHAEVCDSLETEIHYVSVLQALDAHKWKEDSVDLILKAADAVDIKKASLTLASLNLSCFVAETKSVILNKITVKASEALKAKQDLETLKALQSYCISIEDADTRIKDYERMRDENICPYCGNHFTA